MAENEHILAQAEREIDAFDEWFRAQGAERLVRSERAIIKTFLVARASGKLERGSQEGEPLAPCRLT